MNIPGQVQVKGRGVWLLLPPTGVGGGPYLSHCFPEDPGVFSLGQVLSLKQGNVFF